MGHNLHRDSYTQPMIVTVYVLQFFFVFLILSFLNAILNDVVRNCTVGSVVCTSDSVISAAALCFECSFY